LNGDAIGRDADETLHPSTGRCVNLSANGPHDTVLPELSLVLACYNGEKILVRSIGEIFQVSGL
jgi:hypothetical protein